MLSLTRDDFLGCKERFLVFFALPNARGKEALQGLGKLCEHAVTGLGVKRCIFTHLELKSKSSLLTSLS